MRIGFGKVDITPPIQLGLRMAGNAPWPPASGVTWPLHGRVMLADDGSARVAIVCLDLMALPASEVAILRSRLAVVGGLAPAAILVACTHTHRAPFTHLAGVASEAEVFGYLDTLYAALEQAVAMAVADLAPATLLVGRTTAFGWAFNRRPIYAGGEVGTHGPARGNGFIGMEDEPDEVIRVLIARAPDGSIRGGFVAFACHPTVMEDELVFSADYAGVLTEELETRSGGIFGLLQGASGDVAPPDPASDDMRHGFGPAHALAMGRALADAASVAFNRARIVDPARLRSATTHLAIPQRRPTDEQVELARWYLEAAPPDLDEYAFTRRITGHDYIFNDGRPPSNDGYVRELLGMWGWQRRSGGRELVEQIEVQAVAFGDVALVAFPVELFTAFGRRLQASGSFGDTIVVTLANGWHGYVPTPQAFAHGGYETLLAYSSRLVPDAGDRLIDAALNLLRSLDYPR